LKVTVQKNYKSSYWFAKTVFDAVAEKVLAAVGAPTPRPNVPTMSME
jgi:hypothetical protein